MKERASAHTCPAQARCARVQSIAFPPLGRAVYTATPLRSRAVRRRSVQGGQLTRGAQKSGSGVVGGASTSVQTGAGDTGACRPSDMLSLGLACDTSALSPLTAAPAKARPRRAALLHHVEVRRLAADGRSLPTRPGPWPEGSSQVPHRRVRDCRRRPLPLRAHVHRSAVPRRSSAWPASSCPAVAPRSLLGARDQSGIARRACEHAHMWQPIGAGTPCPVRPIGARYAHPLPPRGWFRNA